MRGRADNGWFCRNIENMKQTMFRVAFSILRNVSDCEDAAQNAIIKAYRNLDKLKDRKSFRAWMMRILKNECYNMLRQRKPVLDLDDQVEPVYEMEVPDIDLARAFDRLSPDSRVAITLYYYEGYTTAEIASILDVPEGTIKSRLSRARKDLKGILEEKEGAQ